MSSSLLCKFPTIKSTSPKHTETIGRALAGNLFPGLLVLLSGDLGSGKTALVRSIGSELGINNIKSPTFAIESIYRMNQKNINLVHADLYRLENCSSAVMQLEEYLENGDILLVEWGERWTSPTELNRWDIRITEIGEESRSIDLSAYGERSLSALSASFLEITKNKYEGEIH